MTVCCTLGHLAGDVYYSPRYDDERYTYRHVILSRGVRKEAEKLAATMPGEQPIARHMIQKDSFLEGCLPSVIASRREESLQRAIRVRVVGFSGGLLTEDMFVHCLGIALSPGWTHFMCFHHKLKELILRRPKEQENARGRRRPQVDGAPGDGDEVGGCCQRDAVREVVTCI